MVDRRSIKKEFKRFVRGTCGMTSVEYAVLLAVIAGGIILAIAGLGQSTDETYTTLRKNLSVIDGRKVKW